MQDWPATTLVAALGFALGGLFGATAQRTNFCTMGAISDIVLLGVWNRFRAWLLAMAVAIIGTQTLFQSGQIDLNRSIYLGSDLAWAGAIGGGLLFGFGMTLTGGCGNKTLVRLGAGNLKSLVTALFLGIFAYMTVRGLTGVVRVEIERVTNLDLGAAGFSTQAIPDLVAAALTLDPATTRLATAAALAGGLLWFCFKDRAFRASRRDVAAGIIIGALVPAAWYVTGVLGADEFEPQPLTSFTFVAPIGEAIQYLMTYTGATINFGIAAVAGVIAGAFVMALARREFRIEAFTSAADLGRHMAGGALMGIGGVMALGCTIGQGITGMSTLALGSLLAFVAIVAGGFAGIKSLEHGGPVAALGVLLGRR